MNETLEMDSVQSQTKAALPASDTDQPTPTDLALIAAQLATKSRQAMDAIAAAYDLWVSANTYIQDRKTEVQRLHEQQFAEAGSRFMERFLAEPVTFNEIISKKLLRKKLGEKKAALGDAAVVATRQGIVKTLKKYFDLFQPDPDAPASGTAHKRLTPVQQHRADQQRKIRSQRWLADILKEKAIPYDLFQSIKVWRSNRRLDTSHQIPS